MRGESRIGLLGQTRQTYLPLESFLKEEPSRPSTSRSFTLLFLYCASLAQLSPPNTLIFGSVFNCSPPDDRPLHRDAILGKLQITTFNYSLYAIYLCLKMWNSRPPIFPSIQQKRAVGIQKITD